MQQGTLRRSRSTALKKNTEASQPQPQPQPQTGIATNIPSKSTTSTWMKFDIMGKSGVKLPCMALVDLEVEKSFMSYGTWVISGQQTLDKDHKTIQACGKSLEECLGLVKLVIHINS